MHPFTLTTLALKHTRNALVEEVYIHTGRDYTQPVSFYGMVNERCNVKCRYCDYWRLKHYVPEMTTQEWQRALLSIKEFVGRFSINFSGGEPFIKPGFIDLLAWCGENGISAGVCTNGSALTQRNAAKVVAGRPFNVNISVDAPNAEVHDYLRGYPGLFNRLSAGIRFLVEEREKQGVDFPIMIKPTIGAKNFRYLPELVKWAKEVGASCVNMQPMNRWTPETYNELWIEEDDLPEFEQVVNQLLMMSRLGMGAPILNSEMVLGLFADHFRGKQAPAETMPCRVGMRDFIIETDGNVRVCFDFPVIGNVKEQSARDIWYGEKAEQIRKGTIGCGKLCLITCLSQKTIKDKVKMGLKLLNGQKHTVKRGAGQSIATTAEV